MVLMTQTVIKTHRFLPIIYELDKREEWTDPTKWAKANPDSELLKGASVRDES